MDKQALNFSLWADYIDKSFVEGKLKEMISDGTVSGATSNPTIFKDAFLNSASYKDELALLKDKTPYEKYEHLAISEIKRAAQTLRSIYEASDGKDGFVSIEINPFLANKTDESIQEGKKLFHAIGEPNVMIKVPATEAGTKVMTELLNDNIAVNATLIFSPTQAKAILQQVSNIKDKTKPIVLSVFVSRFDRLLNDKVPASMKNRVGIMNGALIYNEVLKSRVSNAKTLFASTGVKIDQKLSNDYYITKLLAPNSINTAPISAIEAFVEAQIEIVALPLPESKILGFFKELQTFVNIDDVYDELIKDGLAQFENSFTKILESL
jgi:transaldolase